METGLIVKETKMIVTYVSENMQEYSEQLKRIREFQQLKDLAENWKEFAFDAWLIVQKMTPEDFQEFQMGFAMECTNRVQGAGPEWQSKYGAVVLPEMLLRIAMLAMQYHVPFGCAWIRCEEMNLIGQNAVGAYIWLGKTNVETSQTS